MGSLDNVMDDEPVQRERHPEMRAPFDVVLSGPITGVKGYKLPFELAHARVRVLFREKHGRDANVWNPARLPDGHDNEWYMRRCHEAIFDSPCCVLVQLEGWRDSKGSRSEHALCVCLGRSTLEFGMDERTRTLNGRV